MAKLLLMHLNQGMCGDNQVISRDAVLSMQVDRIRDLSPFSYGMGRWIRFDDEQERYLFTDPGLYVTTAWIDTKRMIGGFVAFGEYTDPAAF